MTSYDVIISIVYVLPHLYVLGKCLIAYCVIGLLALPYCGVCVYSISSCYPVCTLPPSGEHVCVVFVMHRVCVCVCVC